MKRSSSVRLTLMSAAVATGGLAACGDADVPKPGNFTTLESCIEAGNSTKACSAARDQALATHETQAPKFASKEECLKGVDVSDCRETRVRQPDGSFSNMFVPAVAGFVLGRVLSGGSGGGFGGGGFSGGYGGGPFYGSRDYPNQYRDSGNLSNSRTSVPTIGSPSSGTSVTTPSRPPNVGTTTISRGGFGSSASFGGGGS